MSLKKKSSFVWNYFTVTENGKRAMCNICNKELSYSAATMSNLGRHIKKKHPEIIKMTPVDNSLLEESPIEVFSVQEVEEVSTEGKQHLKNYEITVNSFEEMEQDVTEAEHEPAGTNWTPVTSAQWQLKSVSGTGPSREEKVRKTSRRSALWDHFEKSPCKTSATCLHCGKTIKLGTITNLGRHLRRKHPTTPVILQKSDIPFTKEKQDIKNENEEDVLRNEMEICTEVVEINVDDNQNPINVIETKLDECRSTVLDYQYDSVNGTNITQGSQTEFLEDTEEFDITDYIRPKKTAVIAEQIDYQLVKAIVKGCHPVNIVEETEFKNFVSLLNPKYELPTTNKIIQELIPVYYHECEKKASKSLQAAEGVCLHIDQWKSKTSNYMCVTAHFINVECKFESLFLSCYILSVAESISEISERLTETTNEWGITEKIVAVVTDNTSTISTAVTLCNWPHVPHFVRALSIIVHESLQTIKPLVYKVKNIIEELMKTPGAVAEIYSTQKKQKLAPVKLITKVKDEWSSSFTTVEMLTRFLKLKTAICQVQENFSGMKLTENDWRVLKSVVELLGTFKAVKKEVIEENRIALSKILFYIKAFKREIKKFQSNTTVPSIATYLATIAETTLKEQFKDLEGTDFISDVLLLDPRLKKHIFDDESEIASACSKLKKEVCEVTLPEPEYCEPDPKSLWYSFDLEMKKLNAVKDPIGKGILELENYLQEQLLGRDEDPLVWWEQRKAIYPRLFKLAKKYLCVTAKSTVRESITFKSAYLLSHCKYSEISSNESEIMFLHHNM